MAQGSDWEGSREQGGWMVDASQKRGTLLGRKRRRQSKSQRNYLMMKKDFITALFVADITYLQFIKIKLF